VDDAAQVAEDLIREINQPAEVEGNLLHVGCSIGITIYPFDDDNIDNLLQDADVAMYKAKSSGRNNYQYFSAEMSRAALERLTMEQDLRQALARDELLLYYQPQIELKTGRVLGAEALLRWQHHSNGMVSPGKFIPILEESGLIVEIGAWVLRSACEQIQAWQAEGLPGIKVAVNTSARQFLSDDFVHTVRKTVADTGIDISLLEVELTEGTLVEDVDTATEVMRQLHDMGITLAVDDFGTGYSSLSYLQRFPLHTLKIDQSFVRDIAVNKDSAAIATTIALLARNMKLNTIAEGVETAEQLALIRQMGCNEVQGYYFGRPMAADEFLDWYLNDTHQGVIPAALA
jgi:EAL domain-containing protein (putative c-di-GMP-specific phosphodiesterase class I)